MIPTRTQMYRRVKRHQKAMMARIQDMDRSILEIEEEINHIEA